MNSVDGATAAGYYARCDPCLTRTSIGVYLPAQFADAIRFGTMEACGSEASSGEIVSACSVKKIIGPQWPRVELHAPLATIVAWTR